MNPVFAIVVGPGEQIYLGTQSEGISYFDGSAWRSLDAGDGLGSRYLVKRMIASPSGGVWAVGHDGLNRVVPAVA